MNIITAEQAIESNVTSRELHSIAGWHEVRSVIGPALDAKRHAVMAERVRAVAFTVQDMIN